MVKDLIGIRIPKGKIPIYEEYKHYVTEVLGSDVCYATISLMEAFNQAIKNAPNPGDPITIQFLRQAVQINIGCNFHYQPGKARRDPTRLPEVSLDKNRFLPLLLEEWESMTPKAKEFWTARLIEKGIMTHPSVSSGTWRGRVRKIRRIMEQSITFVIRLLGRICGKN